jgi:hypothetical protein
VAVAAFSRSRHEATQPIGPARRALVRSLITRAALVKMVAGVAVVLVGGSALAAGTGTLPAGVQHRAHDLLSPVGIPVPDAGARTPGARLAPVTSHPGASPAPTVPSAPASTDAPGLRGLCQAWSEHHDRGEAVDPGVLKRLDTIAGGTDNIPAYCAGVLDATPTPTPAAHPATPDATPSHPGGGKGHDHPTPTPKH